MEVTKVEKTREEGGAKVSGLFNIKRRLLIGGPILIVLGLIVYLVRGTTAVLALPVIGVVLIIVGVLYKPRKKPEPPKEEEETA